MMRSGAIFERDGRYCFQASVAAKLGSMPYGEILTCDHQEDVAIGQHMSRMLKIADTVVPPDTIDALAEASVQALYPLLNVKSYTGLERLCKIVYFAENKGIIQFKPIPTKGKRRGQPVGDLALLSTLDDPNLGFVIREAFARWTRE
jgi:hypothetical protein